MFTISLGIGVHCAHINPYLAFGCILVGKPKLMGNFQNCPLVIHNLAEVRERGIEGDVLVTVGRALRENHRLGGFLDLLTSPMAAFVTFSLLVRPHQLSHVVFGEVFCVVVLVEPSVLLS